MMHHSDSRVIARKVFFYVLVVTSCWLVACHNTPPKPLDKVVVEKPALLNTKVSELLQESIRYALENNGRVNDSVYLKQPALLQKVYDNNKFQPFWSTEGTWQPLADSIYQFIYFSKRYGLFPSDYFLNRLLNIRNGLVSDTLHRKNAALWARADLMLTDAYFDMARDIKLGRIPRDSITLRNDSLVNEDFFLQHFREAISSGNIKANLETLEPALPGYHALKEALPGFLDSISFVNYTHVAYPGKDSVVIVSQLEKRLEEAGFSITPGDSLSLKTALRTYQKEKGLPATGRLGDKTTASLNNTPWEKFKRIAIALDRYKLLPDTLPHQYLWVNLPAFEMQLWDADTLFFQSRVVVGKPKTRTPVLNSKLTDMITYPQWTIPTSIIEKEVLPGLKKDTNYLVKKGYSLINAKGEEVNPATVNWYKYKKGIPYKVIQGSGDDNALGVLKFNFSNHYSVYLHDTNQRYYFQNAMRALSHGCVRVQQWQKLAYFIIRNDSLNAALTSQSFKADSLKAWLNRKEKHIIPIKTRIPLFIRYYTVEAIGGRMKFHDDIYGEDKFLIERYFSNKPVN
jgi:murein L,D-transpeptidase YcbB/YkuD